MRIKKLELIGFKSFKDRTVIHFDEGITGIVGPNGCGKSNIVDALVWVMGEMSAKHLRGSSMEDVIFAGADGYAPMGLAEVSLTLENDGGPFPAKYLKHPEIMVCRRLHRSGESEYLVNKEPARLKDIQEIFMDTGAGAKGFSIIEQGAIGKIITSKPEERRTLIEEAAGITKFKVRKKESQRKLTTTEQNLVRLYDIVGEVKRQLDSLERQVQKAEKYRKLKDELRDKELYFFSQSFLRYRDERQQVEETAQGLASESESLTTQAAQVESKLQKFRLEIAEKETLISDLQSLSRTYQTQITSLEREVNSLEVEIERAKRSQEVTGPIIEQYRLRERTLNEDLLRLQSNLEAALSDFEVAQSDFESRRTDHESLQKELLQFEEELTTKRRELIAATQSESHLDANISALSSQEAQLQSRWHHAEELLVELKSKHQEFETRRSKIFQELESARQLHFDLSSGFTSLTESLKSLQINLSEKQKELQATQREYTDVASRLKALESLDLNFEGFEEGVRQVMLWQKGRENNGLKPLTDCIEIDSKYDVALNAVMGARLQLLISPETETAIEAVGFLKGNQSGRSSFLSPSLRCQPLASKALRAEPPFRGLKLSEVVRFVENEEILRPMLDGVWMVDDLEPVFESSNRPAGWTFVTPEGDVLSDDGVLTGGTVPKGEGQAVLNRRREIKELIPLKQELAGKVSLLQLSIEKLTAEVAQLSLEIENARKKATDQEIVVAQLKKDFERSEVELENASRALQRQRSEVTREQEQVTAVQEKLEEFRSAIISVRAKRSALGLRTDELDQVLKESRLRFDQVQGEVTKRQVELAAKKQAVEGVKLQKGLLEKSLSETRTQINQMSEESEKSFSQLSVHQVEIEEKRGRLTSCIHEAQAIEQNLNHERNQFELTLKESRQLEQEIQALQSSLHQNRIKANDQSFKLQELQLKQQNLSDQVMERYATDLGDIAESYRPQEGQLVLETSALEGDIADLKQKISRLGEVNLSSIQEFEELSKRYQFLKQQQDDLVSAKEELSKVIDRINKICSKRFRETFDAVNERFIKVFPVLFGGGEARLTLIEEPENEEMGIDIVAKPPGKKMTSVTLMSGGEKALTAVSLIFSIFLVKPSPFCLLDEVDAPLDDANVSRFNDLVREMAKRSQIIIVTHNKHTMAVNNKLYGVTMQEKGVSKMVSVRLDEVPDAKP